MAESELGMKVVEGIVAATLGEGVGHGITHGFHFVTVKARSFYLRWRRVEAVVEAEIEAVEAEVVQELTGLWFWLTF